MTRRQIVKKLIFGSLLPFVRFSEVRSEENLFVNFCNIAIAHEYGAIVQYINHSGIIEDVRVVDVLMSNMRDEVEHARGLTSILVREGATPTVSSWPPASGMTVKKLLEEDIKGEEAAIDLYEQILSLNESSRYRSTIAGYLKKEREHREKLIGLLNVIKG